MVIYCLLENNLSCALDVLKESRNTWASHSPSASLLIPCTREIVKKTCVLRARRSEKAHFVRLSSDWLARARPLAPPLIDKLASACIQ
eukprot:6178640-Pleurochrysis_carterae.AAC.1